MYRSKHTSKIFPFFGNSLWWVAWGVACKISSSVNILAGPGGAEGGAPGPPGGVNINRIRDAEFQGGGPEH